MRYALLVVVIAACSKREAPKPSGGSAGCLDLLACYRACPQMAAECTATCDARGTAEARAANLALITCFGAHNCQDEACLTTSCGAELQACASAAGGVAAPGAPTAPTAPTAASAGAASDQDYEFVGQDGLTYDPELAIVARGVALGLAGVWRESKRNITLELGDSTYSLRVDETAFGTGGVTHVETGDWKLDGTSLVVTPAAVKLSTSNGLHQEGEGITPDGPRTWSLEGVTLEWTSMGSVHEVHRADGLVISGPPPSWTSGPWSWTLRRAK